ncbi:MAG TPA: flavodoxin domain-containing protein [Rhizobiaceae bacterium]|nr:flavodoxin domain-containing protein [Rhizobiaceae bacterium]
MHVIIVYGSIEGQTRKIARTMAATVQSAGHQATVFDAADLADLDLALADAVIVAAPVDAGSFPQPLVHWLAGNCGDLNGMPTAFVSVSLAAASAFPEELKEIEALAAGLSEKTGWVPERMHHAAGALRYTKYDFFKRLLMRHIAKKEGGPLDVTADHEFTDWTALAEFVSGFLAKAAQETV